MPLIVKSKTAAEYAETESLGTDRSFEAMLEMVPRNCRLEHYKKIAVPTFPISGEIIAYASPDSTFAVTKKLLDSANKKIEIGIYDFSAGYISDLLKDAMARGVK